MNKKEEQTQKTQWYVSIHSNGLERTYVFDSDKDRDWLYDILIDRSLRNQKVQIKDGKNNETLLIPLNSTILKGNDISEIDLAGVLDTIFHKKDDLSVSIMNARF